MRIMAVDYGDVRTGVAVSDRSGTLAGEVFVITETNAKKLAARLLDEAASRDVCKIIVGNPLNMDGSAGPRAQKSAGLLGLLQAEGMDGALWDERRTTVEAGRILHNAGKHGKKNRQRVDAVAAALILEGYISRIKASASDKSEAKD